jgi:hypothetical protein
MLPFLFLASIICVGCNQNNKAPAGNSAAAPSTTAAKSSGAASSSSDDYACKLVTKAEVEEVIGEKMKDPDSGSASMQGGSICMFGSPDSMSAKNVTIRVESPNFDWNKYKEERRIEGEKMAPKRGYIRPVPGLGQEAYFARHVLHVKTDRGILRVSIFKSTADAIAGEEKETPAEALEKTLAQKAIARM